MAYLKFSKARTIVRKLKIKSAAEWREYSKSSKRPKNIPSRPDRQYKTSGWITWMDWLGTKNKFGSLRKYTVDDNFFKTWSSEMAYIFGFWIADGHIDKRFNIFSITQHHNDCYILKKFLDLMKSDYKLIKHGNNFCFKITSSDIVSDIEKLGGCERKSKIIKFPNVPKQFLPDFIRGLWDGDGSVYFYKKMYILSNYISGSEIFIETLLKTLKEEIVEFNGKIYKHGGNFSLQVGVNDTRRLFKYLYGNKSDLYLVRKYEIFKKSGDIKIATRDKKFMSYAEAKNFIISNGILRYSDWKEFKRKHKINSIPLNLENIYREEWKGWKIFSDTNFLPFADAKAIVKQRKLKSLNEWVEYAKTDRPITIPSNPWSYYKAEWVGIKDWLGICKT